MLRYYIQNDQKQTFPFKSIALPINANVPMRKNQRIESIKFDGNRIGAFDGKNRCWNCARERKMCRLFSKENHWMLIKLPFEIERTLAKGKCRSHFTLPSHKHVMSNLFVFYYDCHSLWWMEFPLISSFTFFPSFNRCLFETVFILHNGALICLPLRFSFDENHCGEWMENFCIAHTLFCALKQRMKEFLIERKRRSKGKCY